MTEMGAELLGGFAPGEWLVPVEPAVQNPIGERGILVATCRLLEGPDPGMQNWRLNCNNGSTTEALAYRPCTRISGGYRDSSVARKRSFVRVGPANLVREKQPHGVRSSPQ